MSDDKTPPIPAPAVEFKAAGAVPAAVTTTTTTVAQVSQTTSKFFIDLNHNGVDDLEELAKYTPLAKVGWSLAVMLVRAFVPKNTVVRRGVESIEQIRGSLGQ